MGTLQAEFLLLRTACGRSYTRLLCFVFKPLLTKAFQVRIQYLGFPQTCVWSTNQAHPCLSSEFGKGSGSAKGVWSYTYLRASATLVCPKKKILLFFLGFAPVSEENREKFWKENTPRTVLGLVSTNGAFLSFFLFSLKGENFQKERKKVE